MITNETFTREWIESFRRKKEYRKVDAALIEKMVHALLLAEKLFDRIIESSPFISWETDERRSMSVLIPIAHVYNILGGIHEAEYIVV